MADDEAAAPAPEEAPGDGAPAADASLAEEPPAEGDAPAADEKSPEEDTEASTEPAPSDQAPDGEVAEPDGAIVDDQITADETAEGPVASEGGADDEKEATEGQDNKDAIKPSALSLTKKDSDASVASEDSGKDQPRKKTRSKARAMGSIISIRKGSALGDYFDRQKGPKYMNSYKLDSDKPFNIEKVEEILKEVLIEALDNLTYDTDKCPKQAKWASSAIRAKVKEQEYDRYKIMCLVTIGEKRSQDVYSIFRFLWDAERDKFAKYSHENMYVFAFALCFGVYYE